jgi:prepilin signal peptidase PulO-like enzyme (type II secretory pathway)
MEPILFFLLGLPVAFVAERLMARFTVAEDDVAEDGSGAAKRLVWQQGDWPARVRIAVAATIPPLMALTALRFDIAQAFAVSALVVALLMCTATDLLRYRVPNAITYPGTLLALAAALVMPGAEFQSALLAFVAAGVGFLALALATNGGFGLGDVKLAALIGAALGLQASYQALFLGIMGGGLILLVLFAIGAVGRKQAVPYAPFLALAAVAVVLTQGAAFAPL